MKTRAIFGLLLFLAFAGTAQIQKNNKSELTIDQIMQEPSQWIGTLPENISWGENSNFIYFSWNPGQDTLESLHSYSLETKKIKKIEPQEKIQLPLGEGDYNAGYTRKIYAKDGNLFLFDVNEGTVKMLMSWIEDISSPQFAAGDSCVSFLSKNNLFLLNLETNVVTQITNFVEEKSPQNKENNAQAKWLKNQQKELFRVLNEREAERKTREYRRKKEAPEKPQIIYLGEKQLIDATLSPSGKYVIYSTYKKPENAKSTNVTHHITETGYTEEKAARSKVGSPQPVIEMGILDVENDTIIQVKTEEIAGIKDTPAYLENYPHDSENTEILPRKINMPGPVWNDTKDLAIVVARSHDNKDRWILLLHPEKGELELLDRQQDEAWIGGPGIEERNYHTGNIGWMPDGQSVWFQSEVSGFSHLYTVNTKTKEKTALTSGNFEIYNPSVSRDANYFYFTANKNHPGVKHFYRMPVWGGKMIQLTTMEGNNQVILSPDEKYLAIRYSRANQPWELYLQKNKAGAESRRITHSTTDAFNAYEWRSPEFITFRSNDGQEVHARLYRPDKPENQGPAVIFVHGAGYLQNAHKWWSSYFREYMFHNFLADNGYTVLDIDYRGSAGYGRDWRTGIYRHMGGKDLTDHVDGAKMLVEKYDVSPDHIGIYGGSYGGFITLMAMFTQSDVFTAGAALRSVTDWAHYNHGYTSNILNTPETDSVAFVRSSPVYFAEGLEGALLMCHGMVDDNVQFQDIVRLTQRLVELGKENWELAVYPIEAHSFRHPSSWTDEYKRIFNLFEENLKDKSKKH